MDLVTGFGLKPGESPISKENTKNHVLKNYMTGYMHEGFMKYEGYMKHEGYMPGLVKELIYKKTSRFINERLPVIL